MAVYLVNYDLNQRDSDHARMARLIQDEYIDHLKVLQTCWLISTELSSQEILVSLGSLLDPNDSAFVTSVPTNWAAHNLKLGAVEWVAARNDDAFKKDPISDAGVRHLLEYLDLIASGKNLSPGQMQDVQSLIDRLHRNGMAAQGEKQIEQLKQLISKLSKATGKAAFVTANLKYIEKMMEVLQKLVGKIDEKAYKVFKEQMDSFPGGPKAAIDAFEKGEVAGKLQAFEPKHYLRWRVELLNNQLSDAKK